MACSVTKSLLSVHATTNANGHDGRLIKYGSNTESFWHDELPKSNATDEFQPLSDVPGPFLTLIASIKSIRL